MVETINELAQARRGMLWETIQQLHDEGLRARVEASFLETERTIAAWHDFVGSVELAMQAMRTSFGSEAA